jgi:hypothetical protein
MGIANDYDTEPAEGDVEDANDEGISDDQYKWLQE